MKKYNSETPPDYDLSLLDFPLGLFGGKNDVLADPKDVDWFYNQTK